MYQWPRCSPRLAVRQFVYRYRYATAELPEATDRLRTLREARPTIFTRTALYIRPKSIVRRVRKARAPVPERAITRPRTCFDVRDFCNNACARAHARYRPHTRVRNFSLRRRTPPREYNVRVPEVNPLTGFDWNEMPRRDRAPVWRVSQPCGNRAPAPGFVLLTKLQNNFTPNGRVETHAKCIIYLSLHLERDSRSPRRKFSPSSLARRLLSPASF